MRLQETSIATPVHGKEQTMKRLSIGQLMLTAILVVSVSGCATMISGSQQTVRVESYPPGAHVAYCDQSGITPVSFVADKRRDDAMLVSQGPDTRVVVLKRGLDPATLWNLIPPLWPGLYVDWSSGAMRKFQTDVVTVDFRSGGSTAVQLTASRQ
jgi:hypothetical protein